MIEEEAPHFPHTITTTYACCSLYCGRREFNVLQSVSICYHCGRAMKQTYTATYNLDPEWRYDPPFEYEVVPIIYERKQTKSGILLQRRRPNRRSYWLDSFRQLRASDFPALSTETVSFKSKEFVAFAICTRQCGFHHFIVDGAPQICPMCGYVLFRTSVRRYTLREGQIIGVYEESWLTKTGTSRKNWLRQTLRSWKPIGL